MTQLNLLVLRTAKIDSALAFYRALGLDFVEEQHGTGPIHYACEMNGMVIEIYPGDKGDAPERKQGGATMLGFRVEDLDAVLASMKHSGIEPLSAPKESTWGRRAMVVDPDGRAVELSEQKISAP